MRWRLCAAAVAIVAWTPAWAAAKNLALRERTTINGNAHEAMQYWTDTTMVTDDPQARTITNLKQKTVTWVDKGEKRYSVMSFDEVYRRADEHTKYLATAPAEVRVMMGTGTPITLRPTGKTENIVGHEAKEYAVEAAPMSGSVWITETIDAGAGAREFRKIAGLLGGPGRPGGRLAQALATVNGLLLRKSTATTVGSETITVTTEVVEVSEMAPPAEVLEVPVGFKKLETP